MGMVIGPWLVLADMTSEQEELANNLEICVAEFWIAAIIWVVFNDIFMTVSLTFLFVRPLHLLRNQLDDTNVNQVQTLADLSKKYMVLSMTAVVSGLGTMFLVGIFKFSPIAAIDVSINSTCLVLFSKFYTGVYENLCGCMIEKKRTPQFQTAVSESSPPQVDSN